MDLSLEALESTVEQDRELVRLDLHRVFQDRITDLHRNLRISVSKAFDKKPLKVDPEPSAGIFTNQTTQALDDEVFIPICRFCSETFLEKKGGGIGLGLGRLVPSFEEIVKESINRQLETLKPELRDDNLDQRIAIIGCG
eukprot:1374580-Amorphochlora_amoeboformis.AAC.2